MFKIEPAVKSQAKAKIAIVGPAGSGKTYTSLVTAQELGEKVLVLDTENRSSVKYADLFNFDVMTLPNYSIKTYVEALEFVISERLGFDVVIVDSLSHAWAGKGGALEQAEHVGRTKFSGNKFAGWSEVTPLQNQLIDTILNFPTHLIATMRMKIEYALVTNSSGKQEPKKLGLGIVQRNSFEYEFDIIAQMDVDHNLIVTKSRCFELDGFSVTKPDGEMGQTIKRWLDAGEPQKTFLNPDDMLYQVYEEFGLSENEAKAKFKELGYTGFPKNGPKLAEMYKALSQSIQSE